jgi:formylglycine-generating enzyme required for sulfatase activity
MFKSILKTAGITAVAAVFCMAYGDDKNALDMVLVKGGTFTMGCTAEQSKECGQFENPAHKVTLRDFYIGKYEVTQKLWNDVMGYNPSFYNKNPNLPVEMVNWDTIQVFIQKLNAKTGKEYRLPTEAEWEYAARGGDKSNGYKYSGSNNIKEVAWYKDNSDRKTNQVGTKQANELGIHDMSGNVWEWVNDWYEKYTSDAQDNPTGPFRGGYRVARGGNWGNAARDCRVSYRSADHPSKQNASLGFRLALSPDQ